MAKQENKDSANDPKIEGLLEEDDEFEEFPVDGKIISYIYNVALGFIYYVFRDNIASHGHNFILLKCTYKINNSLLKWGIIL